MSEMDELFEMFFKIEPDAIAHLLPPLSGGEQEEYIQLD